VCALLALGCRPPTLEVAAPAEWAETPFAFLVDGGTTRTEAVLRLGAPSAVLEQGRVLTYAYTRDGALWCRSGRIRFLNRGARVYPGGAVQELVLAFDAQGLLSRHSLVVSR
jgi:hypothetical protein